MAPKILIGNNGYPRKTREGVRMTANAPIDFEKESANMLLTIQKWPKWNGRSVKVVENMARSLAERVEELAYKNVESHTGFNLKGILRLYAPKSDKEEGK